MSQVLGFSGMLQRRDEPDGRGGYREERLDARVP